VTLELLPLMWWPAPAMPTAEMASGRPGSRRCRGTRPSPRAEPGWASRRPSRRRRRCGCAHAQRGARSDRRGIDRGAGISHVDGEGRAPAPPPRRRPPPPEPPWPPSPPAPSSGTPAVAACAGRYRPRRRYRPGPAVAAVAAVARAIELPSCAVTVEDRQGNRRRSAAAGTAGAAGAAGAPGRHRHHPVARSGSGCPGSSCSFPATATATATPAPGPPRGSSGSVARRHPGPGTRSIRARRAFRIAAGSVGAVVPRMAVAGWVGCAR